MATAGHHHERGEGGGLIKVLVLQIHRKDDGELRPPSYLQRGDLYHHTYDGRSISTFKLVANDLLRRQYDDE